VWNETIPLTGGTVWHVVHTESDPHPSTQQYSIWKAALPCCLASNKSYNPSTLGSAEFHLGWGQRHYFTDYCLMKVESLWI